MAKQWSVGIKDYRINDLTLNKRIAYCLYNIPELFTAQNLITRYEIVKESPKVIIKITTQPDYLDLAPDANRQQNYSGKWILKENLNETTQIQFYSISFMKPTLPRFLQDLITQRMLIQSFEKFIMLTENERKGK